MRMRTPKLIAIYVVPQMIGLVFNSIYFIVDGVFIGWILGPQALAAAGVAVPVVEGMIAISMMISVGTGVLISAAAGRGREEAARSVFNVSVVFTVLLTIVIAAAGVLFTRPLSVFLGAQGELVAGTTTYLQYFMAFSPFLVFSYALSTYVRNDGKPKLAMWALILGSLLNVILDWIFMVPLQMGLAGAALATGLGPVFSVLLLLPHFLRKKGKLYFEKVTCKIGVIGRIITGGLPAFVAEFSIGFVTLLYNQAIVKNGLGEKGLAAYVVMGYMALIAITAFLGAAQGAQPAVSYFAAAKQSKRIRKLFGSMAFFLLGIAIVIYVLLLIGSDVFFGLFLKENVELLQFAKQSSILYFLNLPMAAINILVISFLQAMRAVKASMIVSLTRSTVVPMLFLWGLPLILGQTGLWLAIVASELVTLLVTVPAWRAVVKRLP